MRQQPRHKPGKPPPLRDYREYPYHVAGQTLTLAAKKPDSYRNRLMEDTVQKNKRFGIRVRLNDTDPFRQLIEEGWTSEHWYATPEERDAALEDMSGRHRYSRLGDLPTLVFERVER